MSDEKSIYLRIETGYASTPYMNDELVEKFNSGNFTRRSAIFKNNNNPKKLIVQHLPVKEREKEKEINRMGNGYIKDVLTSVDIQEIVKIVGRGSEICEVVF